MNKLLIDLNSLSDFKPDLLDVQYSPGYLKELEHKIKQLEHQNDILQSYKSECDRLNMELKHISTLKDTYEEKYNEASMKLIYIEDDDSLIFTESEQIKNMNEKVQILVHANEDLRKEVETSKTESIKLKQEIDNYKEKIKKIENSNNNLTQITETKEKTRLKLEKLAEISIKRNKKLEKVDKETSMDLENSFKSKKKSASIGDDIRDHFVEKNESFDKSEKNNGKKNMTESSKGKKEVEKFVKRKKSLEGCNEFKNFKTGELDQFSKTFSNPINIKINVEKVFSPTLANSISPVTRDMNSPKFKNKLALSRQSPKVKVKKQKSIYIPSFMRKSNKLIKK